MSVSLNPEDLGRLDRLKRWLGPFEQPTTSNLVRIALRIADRVEPPLI